MPTLTWNEITRRAVTFAHDWCEATSERAEAQTFWNDFFAVFGIGHRAAYLSDCDPRRYAQDSERVAFLFTRYAALTSLLAE